MTSVQAFVCITAMASWLKACSDFFFLFFFFALRTSQEEQPGFNLGDQILLGTACKRFSPLCCGNDCCNVSPSSPLWNAFLCLPLAPLSFARHFFLSSHAEESKWEKWLNHIWWRWGQSGSWKNTGYIVKKQFWCLGYSHWCPVTQFPVVCWCWLKYDWDRDDLLIVIEEDSPLFEASWRLKLRKIHCTVLCWTAWARLLNWPPK